MKINELEKEIKELREENEHVYKSMVENSRKQISDFKEKLNKTGISNKEVSFNLRNLVKKQVINLAVKDFTKK